MEQLEFDFMKPEVFGQDWDFGSDPFTIESWIRYPLTGTRRVLTDAQMEHIRQGMMYRPVERNYDNPT